MKLKDNSFLDMIVKNILKINNIDNRTTKEYDLLVELIYNGIRPILDREFLLINYINWFMEEKQRLESDEEYYNKECIDSKELMKYSGYNLNNKERRIIFLSENYARIKEINEYSYHNNISHFSDHSFDIRPYIQELRKNVR